MAFRYPEPEDKTRYIRERIWRSEYDSLLPDVYDWPEPASRPPPTTEQKHTTDKHFPCFRDSFLQTKREDVLKFMGFSVFYSPLPLCLFFPMNLHFCLYRMDLLTTLLMPTCTLKSDDHNAFILICRSYHIRDIKKVLANVFTCAPVHSCRSICYLLLQLIIFSHPVLLGLLKQRFTSVDMSTEFWEEDKFNQILRTNCQYLKMSFYFRFILPSCSEIPFQQIDQEKSTLLCIFWD